MTMQSSTLDRIKKLERLYSKGYQSEIIDQTLEKVIALESANTRQELKAIHTDLSSFEEEHQMNSEDFHARFHAGELGDNADFFEWSALYDMEKSVRKRLQSLGHEVE